MFLDLGEISEKVAGNCMGFRTDLYDSEVSADSSPSTTNQSGNPQLCLLVHKAYSLVRYIYADPKKKKTFSELSPF